MSDQEKKKNSWTDFRFPKNITYAGRGVRLFIGTGLFTLGFMKQKGLFLFLGITELLSAATAYSPIYDGYHIYKNRMKLTHGSVPKDENKDEKKED